MNLLYFEKCIDANWLRKSVSLAEVKVLYFPLYKSKVIFCSDWDMFIVEFLSCIDLYLSPYVDFWFLTFNFAILFYFPNMTLYFDLFKIPVYSIPKYVFDNIT